MTSYDSVSTNARLRQLLTQRGGTQANEASIVEQRLAELKGVPIDAVSASGSR